MTADSTTQVVTEALEGRVAVLPDFRVYKNFRTLTWSFASIGCASYSYLVGNSLATLGNTLPAITGY